MNFSLKSLALGAIVALTSTTSALASPVTPHDWVGEWKCNIDGRTGILKLELADRGSYPLVGAVSDSDGDWKSVTMRRLTSSDPPTERVDHLLPLRFGSKSNLLFMMHTWDRNYASGFGYYEGVPYGRQCRKMR